MKLKSHKIHKSGENDLIQLLNIVDFQVKEQIILLIMS